MVQISADIPGSLPAALKEKAARLGGGVSSIVTSALARYLKKPLHTIFQVSTSGVLVAGFSSAFDIAGYHFHFLSADRQHGGDLLDAAGEVVRLRIEALTDFHFVLPESEAFLKADLSRNAADELAYAEEPH